MIYKNIKIIRSFIILVVLTGFVSLELNAQTRSFEQKSHLGISVGIMNYMGFMNGKALTFKQAQPSFEGMYRYDVTNQFHVRLTAMLGSLARTNDGSYRPGSFKTMIGEMDILPEYDFIDLNKHNFTPYIFAGVGYYRLFHYKKDGQSYAKPDNNGFNARAGLGIKYAVNSSLELFLEGSRREFSKSIDFYDSKNSPSRYYSVMVGASFRLAPLKLKELW